MPKPITLAEHTAALASKLAKAEYPRQSLTAEEKAAIEAERRAAQTCVPNCPICGGGGLIRYDVDRLHPLFGKVEVCPNRIKLVLQSGDPRYGLTANEVENLNWGLILDAISDGPKAAAAVRGALAEPGAMAYLYGSFGQAKTLSLKIAIAETLRAGKTAVYANMVQILDDLKLSFDAEEDSQHELMHRIQFWQNLPVLAIDELDKANMTEWAKERIHQLLDQRWVRAIRGEGVTLLAANSPATDLSGYLASRIKDSRFKPFVVKLDGPDGRQSMPFNYPY